MYLALDHKGLSNDIGHMENYYLNTSCVSYDIHRTQKTTFS